MRILGGRKNAPSFVSAVRTTLDAISKGDNDKVHHARRYRKAWTAACTKAGLMGRLFHAAGYLSAFISQEAKPISPFFVC